MYDDPPTERQIDGDAGRDSDRDADRGGFFDRYWARVVQAGDDALLAELRSIEQRRREDAARQAVVLGELERRRAYRRDGHATMYGLLRSTVGWSDRECRDRMRVARLVGRYREVGESLSEGWVPVAHCVDLGRVAAAEHLADAFDAGRGELLREAERQEFDDFRRTLTEWEHAADPVATSDEAAARHERRRARCHLRKDGGELVAEFGPLGAIEVREIFDQYVAAEWEADWEDCVARWGDQASPRAMARTDAQRRADAVVQVFRDAAARGPGAKRPEPVVNIHVDYATFTDLMTMARLFPERDVDPFDDPIPHVTTLMCRSAHGQPLDHATVLQTLLEAHVRFVICNQEGVPINWGRTRRLFTGAARDAVRAMTTRCTHPGCRVPITHTETDHTIDWALGGSTDVDNGNTRCRRHNRLKNGGFTVHRDPTGNWHTYRPDGTEIT